LEHRGTEWSWNGAAIPTDVTEEFKMSESKKVLSNIVIIGAIIGIAVAISKARIETPSVGPPSPPEPGFSNLYGIVTDSLTGQPISGVKVEIHAGVEKYTYSSNNGYYELLDLKWYWNSVYRLPEPLAYLFFEKQGYATPWTFGEITIPGAAHGPVLPVPPNGMTVGLSGGNINLDKALELFPAYITN